MSDSKTPENLWSWLRNHITEIISKVTQVDQSTIESLIEVPPDPSLGDLACTVSFHMAKMQKKNPVEIALEVGQGIEEELSKSTILSRVEVKGPYVNLFFDRGELARKVILDVLQRGSSYGRSKRFNGRRALIEYPAVNPSKPWHIGHSRNAILGDTLGNFLEATGYDVVRIDYINNLGLQIAQLTWKLMQIDSEKEVIEKYDHFLGHLYVEVQEEFEKNEQTNEEIRAIARALEEPDSEAAALSEIMVTKCVKAQSQTAYRLGIFHDYQVWESSIAHSGLLKNAREIMLECENVFELDEGEKAGCIVAQLNTLEEFKDLREPYKVLFRSDGTRTYTGADVAFQMWKFGILEDPFKYKPFEKQPNEKTVYRTSPQGEMRNLGHFDVVFNVIASAQAHPQKLIYTILDLLGYHKQSQNSHHVAYEFVGLEDADFSGRKGTWVGYAVDDVLDKAQSLAKDEVKKRNQNEPESFIEETSAHVATGALRYFMLNASPDRKIIFRWQEALDFNGDAAPYLQYSLARAQRILEKAHINGEEVDFNLLDSDHEHALVKAISRFPAEVLEIVLGLRKESWGTSFTTNRMTAYCYELATLFSRFYDNCPVLKAEEDVMRARLDLVKAFKITMSNCLTLLGIPIVQRM